MLELGRNLTSVLVTGGAGFIGSALCRSLASITNVRLLVLDKLTYAGHLSSLGSILEQSNVDFIQGDICDAQLLAEIFGKFRPDAVMHLAAESHVDRSITSSREFITTNVVGTLNLLEAARAYWQTLRADRDQFRFQYVSTDEIYGSLEPGRTFNEDSRIDPRSPYSASKAGAEHLASAWFHTYGLPVLISGCSNNYGPYQLPEKLVPLAILNALEELPIPLYGDGRNVRDWIYVEDHVNALLRILCRAPPGSKLNVGSRSERTNIEVVQLICDLVDRHAGSRSRRRLISPVADRPGHDLRYAIDPSRIEAQLNWRAIVPFAEGLDSTVVWYLANRNWWTPIRQQGHGKIRLGAIDINPLDGGAKGEVKEP